LNEVALKGRKDGTGPQSMKEEIRMEKTLYMLIGPKGSGKTYIGGLVGKKTDISFLRVESIWLSLKPEEDGWQKVEREIDGAFEQVDRLMVESLGAGEDFHRFYDSLKKRYRIKLIWVHAAPNLCLHRIKNRDEKSHIPVSDSKVLEYNEIAAKIEMDWNMEIDNNGFTSDDEILRGIKTL
jgi:shikimate kinase